MFKKGSFCLATLLMMLLFIIPINLKATTNVLQVSNTSFGVLRGEEFSTTIYVEEGSNVTGLNLTINYNKELVTLVDYKEVEASEVNVIDEKIIIAYSGADNIEDKLDLVELTFKVDEQIAVGNYTNWLYWIASSEDEAFTTTGFEGGEPNYSDLTIQTSFTSFNIRTKGDAYDNKGDGKINARDASYVLQHAAHMFTMSKVNQYYANVYEDYDTNGNPKISSRDASLILQYSAHMGVKLNDRYEVVFYTLNENNEYVEYIKKSVKEGTALTSLPKLDSEVTWSLSSEEYIEVDFNNITTDLKVYEYKESEHIHTIVIDEAIDATCTTTGLTEGSHCSSCGEILIKQEVIEALGHTFENSICSVCGEMKVTENLEYKILSDGTLEVIGLTDDTITELVIPESFNGMYVTSIGEKAFANNYNMITYFFVLIIRSFRVL